jgi:hypothetical protein
MLKFEFIFNNKVLKKVSQTQKEVDEGIDNGNSSSVNLDFRQQFLGIPKSTVGIARIQVFLQTDQNCRVTIEQGDTCTPPWQHIQSSEVKCTFNIVQQVIASYYRVTVTNLSIRQTTYFELRTFLCPVYW